MRREQTIKEKLREERKVFEDADVGSLKSAVSMGMVKALEWVLNE